MDEKINPRGPKARYAGLYARLCGERANRRMWHSQWLAIYALQRDLRRILPGLTGRVLDVGCGDKPYAGWLSGATELIGVDIYAGPRVDVVFDGVTLPFADSSMDAVLCTEVIEHVPQAEALCCEILRVLRPGGVLVASIPFLFNAHGLPHDYRRLTTAGFAGLWSACGLTVDKVTCEGGAGSVLGQLLLSWWEVTTNRGQALFAVKVATLPLFLLASLLVNFVGWLFNQLDHTDAIYNGTLLVGHR